MNSFVRNIGGSIGIALITTSISRIAQQRQNSLMKNTTPGSPAYENLVGGLTQVLKNRGDSATWATQQAHGLVSNMIQRQATTMAYVQVISILALIVLCLIPFILIMRRSKQAQAGQPARALVLIWRMNYARNVLVREPRQRGSGAVPVAQASACGV